MKLQKKDMIIIGSIAIFTIGLYYFLYSPLISNLKNMRPDCKALESQVAYARNRLVGACKILRKRTIASEGDVSLVIRELTQMGTQKGINFISIVPKEVEKPKKSPCKIIPIVLDIESKYKDLGEFFYGLEDLEKSIVTIRSFTIMPDKNSSSMLNTRLLLDMYIETEGKNEE